MPASRVVLVSSFRPIRAAVTGVSASGDYLLITIPRGANPLTGDSIVVNDRLGTTTALDPRCTAGGLGPPWVLMRCPQSSDPQGPYDVELYSLVDGTRRTITISPGMPYCSAPPYDPEVVCVPGAVGAYWMEWVASSYHHLPTSIYFQNIQTGELRADPTTATTFADLNSPALAHKTCPGVALIPDLYPDKSWGSLTMYGQYALATGSDSHDNLKVVLERCGTRTRRLLATNSTVVSNARTIVWQSVTNRMNGLFLPSLQTFTIPLPSGIAKPAGSSQNTPLSVLGLTSGTLYVRDGWGGTLWRSPSPSALPINTGQPTVTRSGRTLTCRRGSWRQARRFSYTWRVNSTPLSGNSKPTLRLGSARKRRNVSCSVTAVNASGTTTATSAQVHTR